MLGQRRKRWPNSKTTLVERLSLYTLTKHWHRLSDSLAEVDYYLYSVYAMCSPPLPSQQHGTLTQFRLNVGPTLPSLGHHCTTVGQCLFFAGLYRTHPKYVQQSATNLMQCQSFSHTVQYWYIANFANSSGLTKLL